MIGHKSTTEEVGPNYSTVISEIVLGKLLDQNQEGYIHAHEGVFEQLKTFGNDLAKQLVEIP